MWQDIVFWRQLFDQGFDQVPGEGKDVTNMKESKTQQNFLNLFFPSLSERSMSFKGLWSSYVLSQGGKLLKDMPEAIKKIFFEKFVVLVRDVHKNIIKS